MCGSFDAPDYETEGACKLLDAETVRARKQHQCDACCGTIPAGAYHGRRPFIGEDGKGHFRFHLQCRDVCAKLGWYGTDVVTDLADDNERGPEWVAHHRAVAVWAGGGEYKR